MFDGAIDAVREGSDAVAHQAARVGPDCLSFDALLRPWCRHRVGAMTVLVGVVYGDARGRFVDGQLIRTSPLHAPESAGQGLVAGTRNSQYLLIVSECRLDEVLTG